MMTKMIRREAMTRLAGSSAGVLLGITAERTLASEDRALHPTAQQRRGGAIIVQGTLTPSHAEGRRRVGFVETGISGGNVLCTLLQQDEQNPAVQSVFATPMRLQDKEGVRVTISFFTEPIGNITFSLLHVELDVPEEPAYVIPANGVA